VVAERAARVDLKHLAAVLGEDRLSFGSPERLLAYLGLTPGAVSPFGVVNDHAHAVTVVVDETLRSAARVAFHPNVNTSTVTLTFADFARFLASQAAPVRYASFRT
jgi:Ala-tRNA(Pro) deacylase